MTAILLRSLLPIFVLIALGFALGRSGRIDNRNVTSLNKILMDIALPASMFTTVVQTTRHELLTQMPLVLTLTASLLILWCLVFLIWRKILKRPAANAATAAISVALPNFAAAGLPLLEALQGPVGHVRASFAIAVGAVTLSPLTLTVLALDTHQSSGEKSGIASLVAAFSRAARAPLVALPCLAVILVMAGILLPSSVIQIFRLMGAAAAGLALLLTGLVLSAYQVRVSWPIVSGIISVTILHPLLSAGLGLLFGLEPSAFAASILLTALPAGFFGIFFALRYEQDVREASAIVLLSTLVSIATLTGSVAWFGGAG
ncbi:AEC family transporter [Asaia prunellae]|uniref:AEC family transporter n=1 Tax=Asaia prunellae TaxID=610245 RepID=UPI000470C9EC|nr:AEC family transporter [Asaia prunellae]